MQNVAGDNAENGNSLTKTDSLVFDILVVILPALVICCLYFALLGTRSDYLGHFAAGYGGTLAALACVTAIIPGRWQPFAASVLLAVTLLCIGAGTVAEATVFCLAKFDGVDYCNQNLGAVLAGLSMTSIVQTIKPSDAILGWSMVVALAYLLIGVYFATT